MVISKNIKKLIASGVIVCSLFALSIPVLPGQIAYAESTNTLYYEDDVAGESSDEGSGSSFSSYLKNNEPMTDEQFDSGVQAASPFTAIIGNLIGVIMAFTGVAIFGITALDLLYISIPPVREFLYAGGIQEGTPQSGGMGGGMGMGGYGGHHRGGMGMGGMQGGQKMARKNQWISDEAVACARLIGGGGQQQQMGGMGMGMQQGGQEPQDTSSVIGAYFKKRIFFMILFALCSIMLLSSIFLGTGVNIANWGMTIMQTINDSIPK